MATIIHLGVEEWDAESVLSTPPRKVPLGPGECETCFDTDLVWTRKCCQVMICQGCLGTYVDGKIDEGVIDIQCPGHNCDTTLGHGIIKGAVDPIKAKRFSFLRVKSERCKYKKACPMCDRVVVLDDTFLKFFDTLESIIACPNPECLKEWCFQCMVPWHEGKTCAEFKSAKTDTGIDKWAKKLENTGGERNAQQCPNCKIWIQKIVGCYFMTCKECQTSFCYTCGVRTPHPAGSKCANSRTGVHGENQPGVFAPRPAARIYVLRPAVPPAAPRPAALRPAVPPAAPGRAVPMDRFEVQDQRRAALPRRAHQNLLIAKIVARFTTGKCDIMWFRCAIVFVFVFICFIGILAHGMLEAYVRPWYN